MAKQLRAWIGQLWKSLAKGKQPLRNKNSRLQVELLEDRAVPANFGTVQGFAFLDANNNGILDSKEAHVSAVKVTLTGTTTGAGDNTSIHVTLSTNSAGFYKFTNVPAGTYKLTTAAVPGLSQGAAQSFTGVNITTNAQVVAHNFIYHGGVTSGTLSMRQFTTNSTASSLPFGTPGTGAAIADHTPTVKTAITPVSTSTTSANTVVDLAGNFADLDFTNSTVTFHITNGKLLTGAIASAVETGGTDPIAITTTKAHGLTTGMQVTIAGVTGFSAANGTFTITVVSPTKFTLNGVTTIGSGTGGTFSSLTTVDSTIKMILFDAATPRTVANFFDYILNNSWDNSIFHRNAKVASGGIGVLQGGAVTVDATGQSLTDVSVIPAGSKVPNEFLAAHSNLTGTIAMAQSGGDVNSATNQFFFNTVNNAASLDSQKFAVFGKVADTASLNALKALAGTGTKDLTGGAFASAHPTVLANAVPVTGYNGTSSTFPTDAVLANYMRITDITVDKRDEFLSYSLVGTNGGGDASIATASFTNEYLTIHPVSAGTTTFTIQAADRYGATVTTTVSVTVTGNHAPVASDGTLTTTEDAQQVGSLVATDADAGDTLTFAIDSQPAKGHVTINNTATGAYTFDPGLDFQNLAAGQTATTTFTFHATDNNNVASQTKTITVTVTGVNDAPTANDANVATDQNTDLPGTLTATDVDTGDTISGYTIVSQPSLGTVTLDNATTGAYTFHPGTDFVSLGATASTDVTFTFKATDSNMVDSAPATITVHVTGLNDAPTSADNSFTTGATAILSNVLAGSDPDTGDTIGFSVIDPPTKGSVTVDPNTGAFTYDPTVGTAATSGDTVTFTYKTTDQSNVDSPTSTITITIT